MIRVLSFVNHVPPSVDPRPAIRRAAEWGIDVVVAQGNGMDFGPCWLGSGEQFPVANFVENCRPYLEFCVETSTPFVLSVGIAGADVHLDACLAGLASLAEDEGWSLDLGVIRSEVDPEQLASKVEQGLEVGSVVQHDGLPSLLSAEEARASVRIVAQVAAESIIPALDAGVDGVITGRALDVGLFMAPALRSGASYAAAAHLGKLLECGGLPLSPGDPGAPIYGSIDDDDILTIRSPDERLRCNAQAVAAHSFYERRNPMREENPGGWLDLGEAHYEQVDERTIRCSGAKWGTTDYTIKLEGAALAGHRAINVFGARDPFYLDSLEQIFATIRAELVDIPRFSGLVEDKDFHLTFTTYGRDAVLGAAEPERGGEHEVGVVIDVVAPTQELAREICYFAYIGCWIKPYPGRKTTAGNNAQRFSPPVIPMGEVYRWSVWHLLPVDDPADMFPFERRTIGVAR